MHSFLRLSLALTGASAVAHPVADHDTWKPTLYAEKLEHAPKPLPDRIVLTWPADPATTQAVSWRTDPTVIRALAEIAIANDNGRDLKPATVRGRSESL